MYPKSKLSQDQKERKEEYGQVCEHQKMSIKRLLLSILAKSSKEVKEISKYFKTMSPTQANINNTKSYTQASKSRSSTKKILKIEKTFPNLKADKIKNI